MDKRKGLLFGKALAFLLPALIVGVGLAGASQQCFPEITCRMTEPPLVQTIAAGQTIVANACGSVKPITAAGAVSTSTVNTFDFPNGDNKGCIMAVCNVGANTITLDANANFLTVGGADVVLTANDCVMVGQRGAVWTQLAPLSAN